MRALKVSAPLRGLRSDEVSISRERFGSNSVGRLRTRGFFRELLSGLGDPIIKILIFSLLINLIFNFGRVDPFEVGGILAAIFLSVGISTFSERSSRGAFEALSARSVRSLCRARRGGEVVSLDSSELVVGDVVLVGAGERIPADGILVDGALSLDQSALTGESAEAEKSVYALSGDFSLDLAEKLRSDESIISPDSRFSCPGGTVAASGDGEILILRVGAESFLGRVAAELQAEVRESPLKVRLGALARQISIFGYAAAVIIGVLSLFSAIFADSGFAWDVISARISDPTFVFRELLRALTLGLTVVIMAVPEGLPMMIAVVLSSNVKRMLAGMVLVRKSAGIEAAGSMNLLFTDKTGTLTRGQMSVEGFVDGSGAYFSSVGDFRTRAPSAFAHFCENAVYNSSAVRASGRIVGGNATEAALLRCVGERFMPPRREVLARVGFDSTLKFSSATLRGTVYFKGAPEVLLPHACAAFLPSGTGDFDAYAVGRRISELQASGRRVIVLCEGEREAVGAVLPELRFVCVAVISDPPKSSSRAAVSELRGAGIGVVMITGDGALTARSVAESVGIVNSKRDLCLSHAELEAMSDEEVIGVLGRLAVVSRALPSDKSRLVRVAQSQNLVVGMTGDGINDAPALRASDVGFAMGAGSEIAKDACDVVILDGNLASIVRAVLYGRNIFKSIRKFLVFQLTMNFSSALVCMIAPLMGVEAPITVTQMLWVNMIMDTLGGVAFAGEAPARRILREAPKRRDEPILNGYMLHQIFFSGSFSVVLSILFLKHPFFASHFRGEALGAVHLSAFFALFIFLGVVECVNSRTDRLNLFSGMAKNPMFLVVISVICVIQVSFVYFGGEALRAVPLALGELAFTVGVALLALPFELLRKIAWRLRGRNGGF